MESYQALAQAVNGNAISIARKLHLSSSMIHKWSEPHTDWSDCGALNPLDRIEALIEESIRLGTPTAKAFSPLHYLANHFNGLFISAETIPCATTSDLTKHLCGLIDNFSTLAGCAAESMQDQAISRDEARRINAAGIELMQAVAEFCNRAQGLVK